MLAPLAGCGPGRISAGDAKLPQDDGSAGFLDRLSSQVTVSENDAMRGVLMLLEGSDQCAGFGERVAKLQARNVVPRYWDLQASRPITRGRLAYMIYQAAKVPGGVVLTITGPTERYCLRELEYRGFVTSSNVFGEVTGSEYVAVLSRADTYIRTGSLPEIMTREPTD